MSDIFKENNRFQAAIGKTIDSIYLMDSRLNIKFIDDFRISIFDNASNCCEVRYMSTDDDLSDFFGAELRGAEIRDTTPIGDDMVHEIQFLVIQTNKGDLTVASHNQHNGYYGGFSIVIGDDFLLPQEKVIKDIIE